MTKKHFVFLAICLLFVSIITSGCGSGKTTTNNQYVPVPIPTVEPTPVKYALELSSTKFTMNVGNTDNITVTLNSEDITETATYTVDQEAIARVEKGVITGLSVGVAIVTVHDDNAESDKNFVVNVIDPNASILEVSKETVSLVVGDTEDIVITLGGNPVTEDVTYDVKDSSVASVEKGKITALGEGSSIVVVSFSGANSAFFTVDVMIENPFKDAVVGDTVPFGRYYQTAKGEIQPIEWRVLHKDNNRLLIVSDYGLDSIHFNRFSPTETCNVWIDSFICLWLNDSFYNTAFTSGEKSFISVNGKLGDNIEETAQGVNVFLLSKTEVETYFANDDARKCLSTEYAQMAGTIVYEGGFIKWWLRSPNPNNGQSVYFVYDNGSFLFDGVGDIGVVVRPALWINL